VLAQGATHLCFRTPVSSHTDNLKYLSVRDCGVFLGNYSGTGVYLLYPLFYTTSDLSNWTSQTVSGTINVTDGVGNIGGIGNYYTESISSIDYFYLVYPNYGIKTFTTAAWLGNTYLNYQNNTSNPVIVGTALIYMKKTVSVRIYYNAVEQFMRT